MRHQIAFLRHRFGLSEQQARLFVPLIYGRSSDD
jgi:hypothetical protein